MRPTAVAALAALAWLLPLPGLVQAPDQGPPPAAASPSDSKLPLAAMRHQQPRRSDVDQLEQDRFGSRADDLRKKQGTQVDKLYEDVMRRSAPGASGQ